MRFKILKVIKKLIIFSTTFLIIWNQLILTSLVTNIYEIADPRRQGVWINDMANLLDTEIEQQLNQSLSKFNYQCRSELLVVTVPDTSPYTSPKQLATYLFNIWHLARIGFYNGVLFLVSQL